MAHISRKFAQAVQCNPPPTMEEQQTYYYRQVGISKYATYVTTGNPAFGDKKIGEFDSKSLARKHVHRLSQTKRDLLIPDSIKHRTVTGTPSQLEWGTGSLVNNYARNTPGQTPAVKEEFLCEKTYKFCSTQATFPQEVAQQINLVAMSLIREADLGIEGRQLVPHITIQYGIDSVDDEVIQKIRKVVSEIPRFDVVLGKVKKFPPSKHSSGDCPVWIAVSIGNKNLTELRNAIRGVATFVDSFPTYTPHVNLGYVKEQMAHKYIGNSSFSGIRVPIDYIDFTTKDGTPIRMSLKSQEPPVYRKKISSFSSHIVKNENPK